MPIRTLIPLYALLAFGLHAQTLTLELDPAHTKVEFSLGATLHTVEGSFPLKHGAVRMDPAGGAASGEIVVDAAAGDSGNSARDRKMRDSVLETSRFPEIVLLPDRIEGALPHKGKATLQMHGVLRVHGADHEISFPVDVDAADGQYNAVMRFDIPYIQWGMKNPSTLVLRVSDKVRVTVRTVAHGVASSAARLEEAAQ